MVWPTLGSRTAKEQEQEQEVFLPARRCPSAGTSYGPVSVCLCLSVPVSVTSRCSVKTAERIKLGFFGMEASFHLSYTILKENSGIFEK